MSVEIKIIWYDNNTAEYESAKKLEEMFANFFHKEERQKINGKIIIQSNITLIGQEVRDIDLIVLWKFDYEYPILKLNSYAKEQLPIDQDIAMWWYRIDKKKKERNIYLKDFCVIIETKAQIEEQIEVLWIDKRLIVKYRWKKHDATEQSEKQKYSFKNYLESIWVESPYISNFIRLTSINKDSYIKIFEEKWQNIFPSTFSIKNFFEYIANSSEYLYPRFPVWSNYWYLWSRNKDIEKTSKLLRKFEEIKKVLGNITINTMNNISKPLLEDQEYAKQIWSKLLIIQWRAWTWKTVKLMRMAYDLAKNRGERCLILTYNHALVWELRRNLTFLRMPDWIENPTVSISTLHKFFYDILLWFGIIANNIHFLSQYKKNLIDLVQKISTFNNQKNNIQNMMISKYYHWLWYDYIFVDEAQDREEEEKETIIKLFWVENIIIADWFDQLVRSDKKCLREKQLSINQFYKKPPERKCLRMKSNLVNFANNFSKKFDVQWFVESTQELNGWKVIIINWEYDFTIHNNELKKLQKNWWVPYNFLFLCPPSLVQKHDGHMSFKNKETFEKNGLKIRDWTDQNTRTEYAIETDQYRILQYDSCRGIEWRSVVCLELDSFYKYKYDNLKLKQETNLNLLSDEEKRNIHATLWTLIALTRPMDTTIITIKDPNSDFSKKLLELADNLDYVETYGF